VRLLKIKTIDELSGEERDSIRRRLRHRARRLKKELRRKKMEKLEEQEVSISIGSQPLSVRDIFDTVDKFRKHFKEVEEHFVERKNELEQIKYAMLTREHVLLKGKTGTAKSKLGKYSFGYIKGANTFAIQLSKFMSEEYLFGAIDINKMRNEGKVEHRTEGSVLDCEFAFIDEVFDGNDALLRSLLEVLNERTWSRHHQKVNAKLHSAILTSNYVREDEVTEAFLDRIMFKSEVKPVSSTRNRMEMYKTFVKHGDRGYRHLSKKLEDKGISYEELSAMADFVLGDYIELPDSIIKVYDMVIREYSKQLNAYVSDRKANKMLNIMKASALVNCRQKVEFEDIESIKFALVTINNEQQEEVFRAVFTKIMSDNVRYQEVSDEIEKLTLIFTALKKGTNSKLNPKSKEILELNEEAQMFNEKLNSHKFINGSGFPDFDTKFSEMRQEVDKVIREVAKTLKLSGK
jgi:MoxR-like ATPase